MSFSKVGCNGLPKRASALPRLAWHATGRPAVCAALQPTLTKCDVLQPIVEQNAEDCGTLNLYESTADAVAGFGK